MILPHKTLESLYTAQGIFTTGKNPGWSIPSGNGMFLYVAVVVPVKGLPDWGRNGLLLEKFLLTDLKSRHYAVDDFQHIQYRRKKQSLLKQKIRKSNQTEIGSDAVCKQGDIFPVFLSIA